MYLTQVLCWNVADGEEGKREKVALKWMRQRGQLEESWRGTRAPRAAMTGPLCLAVWSLSFRLETSYPAVAGGRSYYLIHATLFPLFITRRQ